MCAGQWEPEAGHLGACTLDNSRKVATGQGLEISLVTSDDRSFLPCFPDALFNSCLNILLNIVKYTYICIHANEIYYFMCMSVLPVCMHVSAHLFLVPTEVQ